MRAPGNVVAWIACLWPGLLQAWRLGSLWGLGVAMAFAAALNAALIATLVWPRWPIASLPAGTAATAAWAGVLGLWILGLRWTSRNWSQLCPPRPQADPQLDDWFREAQHEYLKGHWLEAETLVSRILARQPGDCETRLLLASIQRRRGSRDQAQQTLSELQPVASKWQWEIEAELTQLNELEAEKNETLTVDAMPRAA
ncbi:MAG TPA: hypothetical protein VFV87_08405 [Pirellulaceae bacterium]|nr:hypothetical protein [Pirellulaceae bacterium]